MEQSRIDRINELARLARQRQLTDEEADERSALRAEYIADWRKGAIEVLENTYVVDANGIKHKLKKKEK